jgi:hypothetical protein
MVVAKAAEAAPSAPLRVILILMLLSLMLMGSFGRAALRCKAVYETHIGGP